MARSREQNDKMITKTKNIIIEVALKEFALKGYSNSSIRDIAKASNMSTGVMYRYFKSKEALFNHVVKTAIDSLAHSVNEIESSETDSYVTLYKMTEKVLADIETSNEVSLYFLLMSRLLIEGDATTEIEDLRNQDLLLFAKTAELIAQGQLSEIFKDGDPYQLSLYYYSCIQGVANMRFFLKDLFASPKVEDVLAFLKNCPEVQGGK